MKFESKRGPKKKNRKKTCFVKWKVYFSYYFIITHFPLHFKDGF